jgi:hypothetical protein
MQRDGPRLITNNAIRGNPAPCSKRLNGRPALEFLAFVDCVDDGMLRVFQELFAEFNAQLLHKP